MSFKGTGNILYLDLCGGYVGIHSIMIFVFCVVQFLSAQLKMLKNKVKLKNNYETIGRELWRVVWLLLFIFIPNRMTCFNRICMKKDMLVVWNIQKDLFKEICF